MDSAIVRGRFEKGLAEDETPELERVSLQARDPTDWQAQCKAEQKQNSHISSFCIPSMPRRLFSQRFLKCKASFVFLHLTITGVSGVRAANEFISSHADAECKCTSAPRHVKKCSIYQKTWRGSLGLSGPQIAFREGRVISPPEWVVILNAHFFHPPRNFSWALLGLHHPSSPCKRTALLIDNSQEWGLIPWSFRRLSDAAFPPPPSSQVINLHVIGEMHWHPSIKWHLIYALFMPHLCAQVLRLFIKCPLLCKNMEIERRYSWYSRRTREWTGSLRGRPLTVTGEVSSGATVWAERLFS